ncbi:MAG TPA: alkaline phosphatase family protein, partial [Candidatus Angelobacter sp.]|nr:alkaline phosphatase family protein [Candidatus Angelobacter sp.]
MDKTQLHKLFARLLFLAVLYCTFSNLLAAQQADGRSAVAQQPVHAPALAPNVFGITPPDHVVIVMEENHSFSSIIGSSQAPFINSLAQQGALFTQSFAIEHPSEPNYLDLFSGSNQGVTDDSCPHTFSTENLASELAAAGLTFTGFSEDLPSAGSTVCTSGAYARKHSPWINFSNIPTSANQPFTSFPTDFTTLPTISFVIPNLNNDMHDGTISQGDTFLQQHLNAYIQFAQTHNSLLIVTWDEDDSSMSNQIPTIFVGPMVKTGQFSEHITHFNVLRTLEDLYGLTHAGSAANATAISDVWKQAAADFTLAASPTSLSVNQGSSGSTTISTTVTGGFNAAVSLSVSGLPSGVTASFNPASIAAPGSGSSTLTFSASSTATAGTTNVTVTATGGGVTHTTTVALTIVSTAVPSFTVSASPTSVSVVQGSSGSSTISTTVSGGFNSAISLSIAGLPAGVTASFNPSTIAAPGSGSSTLTFAASSTATTGTVNVTVSATGGGITNSTTIALTITAAATPDFTLSASPSSLSVTQGSSGSSTISTTVSGGFNAVVSLSVSGLPAGVTASFNPSSIAAPGSGSSTLTFTASSTAATGTTTVTVNANGGGVTHTATISLTIASGATPDFTVSASPTSVSVAQ